MGSSCLREHRLYCAGVVIAKYQWHENEVVQIERWYASFNCRHDLFHIMLNMLNKEKNIFCGFLVASYLWIFRAANVSDALMSCLIRLYEFCIHYNSDFIITGTSLDFVPMDSLFPPELPASEEKVGFNFTLRISALNQLTI